MTKDRGLRGLPSFFVRNWLKFGIRVTIGCFVSKNNFLFCIKIVMNGIVNRLFYIRDRRVTLPRYSKLV